MKLGRNDPCWCGSGRKYKKCHLNREQEQLPNMGDLVRAQKTSTPKLCLHPDASPENCSGKIIKAHTIQRNGGLSKIAHNGHVYTVSTDIASVIKNGGKLSLQLTGLKNATTFTGFCNKHDTEIFKPIETAPFSPSNEYAFILAYRVLSKELYAKMFQKNICGQQRELDKGTPVHHQSFVQSLSNHTEIGTDLALRDLATYKNQYDSHMLSETYANTKYHIILTQEILPIMCSGGFHPEFTFDGSLLYTPEDFNNPSITLDLCTFSVIATEHGSAIVFSWEGNQAICEKLVQSLLTISDERLIDTLVKFSMEFFENIAIDPQWYDLLIKDQKTHIDERINTHLHDPKCFINDSPTLISSKSFKVHSNTIPNHH
ncbi:SEC-C domain-containing protein [Pontiellaceae bacterium B1224]|nr:SEC-C domain-containing protein [Pontiellaceae bacterium B1224]